MIIRIVKMTFDHAKINEFMNIFNASKYKIISFKGCRSLYLCKCPENEDILFTYSIWDNLKSLYNYKDSSLFETTWKKAKKLFADKP